VNRGGEGPLPAGAAPHDISAPYGFRDMAGNGAEWTRSPRDATEKFEPDQGTESHELLAMILRGRSYLNPDPLHYQDLEDQLQGEARRATEADCDIGFRVVLQVEEAPN
jgi:formylglycine-generating enzyme required for sulfatase activity